MNHRDTEDTEKSTFRERKPQVGGQTSEVGRSRALLFSLRPFGLSVFPLLAAALLELAGCSSPMSDFQNQEAAKYSVLSTDNFVVDAANQNAVSCTGLIEQRTASGHLKITVNIKSRMGAPIQAQAQGMFRDVRGLVVEETPWQAFVLGTGDTETLSFEATNGEVKTYTVRVRITAPPPAAAAAR